MTARKPSKIQLQPVATISVQRAAKFLDISEEAVRDGIRKKTIPGIEYGDRPSYKVYRILLLRMVGYPDDYDFGD